MTDKEFYYWIKSTITGDINKKIIYLKEKAQGEVNDDYYYLRAVSFDNVCISKTNNINDPVGGLATKLADLKLAQKRNYIYFKTFKEITEQVLKDFEPDQLQQIRIFFNLDKGYLRKTEKIEVKKLLEKIKNKFVKEKIKSNWGSCEPDQEHLQQDIVINQSEKEQPKSDLELRAERLGLKYT